MAAAAAAAATAPAVVSDAAAAPAATSAAAPTAATSDAPALVTHSGSCHCRAVTFEVDAPSDVTVWECNCSICAMKRNTHFVVPACRFRLLTGADDLTEYRFNTGVARHRFCRVCGVQAFYHPRSNPDGIAVTIHCITSRTLTSVTTNRFDGKDWEGYIGKSGIAAFSKE